MRKAHVLVVCLSIAVGYILATALNRSSVGQSPPSGPVAQEVQVWRYQVICTGDARDYPTLTLTDTATGRVWVRDGHPNARDEWHSLGSPASPRVDKAR